MKHISNLLSVSMVAISLLLISDKAMLAQSTTASIYNNTIVANTSSVGGAVHIDSDVPTIVNNIIAFNTIGLYDCATTPVLRNNCVYGNSSGDYYPTSISPGTGNGNISSDPNLFDRANGNYHIKPTSPCINAGDDSVFNASWRDMDRQWRKMGLHIDIGADEHGRTSFDPNMDGQLDLIGLASDATVWYSTDKLQWNQINGHLASLKIGDVDGDGVAELVGVAADSKIWVYSFSTGWRNIPGLLSSIVVGDFNGDGVDEIAGVASNNTIWYSLDLGSHWIQIAGYLNTLYVGDVNGDGKDDLIGLYQDGHLYYTCNLCDWQEVGRYFTQLAIGDFNGDGIEDIAGLTSAGQTWYSLDRSNWTQIPGTLSFLVAGDFNHSGHSGLAGVVNGALFYTTNMSTWQPSVTCDLAGLAVGDLNGDGYDDFAGWTSSYATRYTVDRQNWLTIPGLLIFIQSSKR